MNILKHEAHVGLKNIESRATLDIPMWRTKDLSLLEIDKQNHVYFTLVFKSEDHVYSRRWNGHKMHIWGETLEYKFQSWMGGKINQCYPCYYKKGEYHKLGETNLHMLPSPLVKDRKEPSIREERI